MRLELTYDEAETVREFIWRRERNSRQWRAGRWCGLILCAFSLLSAVQSRRISQDYWEGFGSLRERSNEARTATPPTQADIDFRISQAARSSDYNTTSVFCLLVGVLCLVFTLRKWNCHKEDGVLAKILRLLIEEPAEGVHAVRAGEGRTERNID